MPAVGNVQITGNVSNLPTGTETFGPLTITTPSAVGQSSVIALSSGANTVAIPTGTYVIIITGPNAANPVPNPSWAGTLTIKGVSGDTGIAISSKFPTVLPVGDGTLVAGASLIINASTTGATIQVLFI